MDLVASIATAPRPTSPRSVPPELWATLMAAEAGHIQPSAQFEASARIEMQQAAEEQQLADYFSEEDSDGDLCFLASPHRGG